MTSVVKQLRPAIVLAFLFWALIGCQDAGVQPVKLQGLIYGTGWSLTYIPRDSTPPPAEVQAALLAAFDVVNRSMNSYDPTSTLSQFNGATVGVPFEVDWDFTYVLNESLRLHKLTGGAFDVTVSPLLALWGFGPEGPSVFPDQAAIDGALARVGVEKLDWQPLTRSLAKRVAGMALEFSSIAKGYGVDLGADALDEMGITDYMLEIGGEIRLRGHSPRRDPWRIAIERPDAGGRGIQAALSLTDIGLATSGDYRNYFEHQGKRYSHVVDPRSGYPIEHDLVSVTVLHPSTALADGWATALLVLGTEQALALAEEQGLAVYMVSRRGEELEASWSPAFSPYVASESVAE